MSWLTKWFSKESLPDFDFSIFGADMHSHLIPGIDDGSANMEATVEMLRKFQELGYKKIITTPHIKTGVFNNTTEIIQSGEKLVLAEIDRLGLDLKFEAAAEYFFDYSFMERIEKEDLLTFSNGHLLLEYSFSQPPMGESEMFFSLQMKQIRPILAHFERYPYYHGTVKKAAELREKGVKIQLNILSMFGHYGPQVQKQAELLIKEKQVDLIGSDCHRIEHLKLMAHHAKHPLLHKVKDLNLFNTEL
jgi:protein-tyrosine phosphatase